MKTNPFDANRLYDNRIPVNDRFLSIMLSDSAEFLVEDTDIDMDVFIAGIGFDI